MFSLFSQSTSGNSNVPNLHPVSSAFPEDQLFGNLEPQDTEWLCAGGFTTETQTFYISSDNGVFIMCQVIHSSIGLWFPTIQFVFKFHDPKEKQTIWKSVNVNNFVTPPHGLDRRSCKADEFSITYKQACGSSHPELYYIRANLAKDLQLSFEIRRPDLVPGFKVGSGPKGGYTYFGADPTKAEGYVVHRFWPHFITTIQMVHNGAASELRGPGMFVHAIQGMRPNLVATRWNFANFQSEQQGGVSAMQMEFKSCDTHGKNGPGSGGVIVNVGSLVVGGKLVTVTAETKWPDAEEVRNGSIISEAFHLKPFHDPFTGYDQPTILLFKWQGPSLITDTSESLDAKVEVHLGNDDDPKGLIEKVDVLAEIPYVVKKAVSIVAGTKPYIYQWFNRAVLSVSGPETILPGLSKGMQVEGMIFNEAAFVS